MILITAKLFRWKQNKSNQNNFKSVYTCHRCSSIHCISKDVNLARSRFITIFRDFYEIPRLLRFPAPNATFVKYRNFPYKLCFWCLKFMNFTQTYWILGYTHSSLSHHCYIIIFLLILYYIACLFWPLFEYYVSLVGHVYWFQNGAIAIYHVFSRFLLNPATFAISRAICHNFSNICRNFLIFWRDFFDILNYNK